MLHDPTFWVAISFVGFVLVAFYFKLPAMIGKQLDDRSERIAKELEEAQRLREEAQALYAEYKRKAEDAVKQAEQIVQQAKVEADEMAKEARAATETMLERRKAQAEMKIQQAEAQAVKEVREATVDVAITAARQVMQSEVTGDKAGKLIDASIADLDKHLN
ncbi:MAG: ATP F0F1 synthase subunit B [Minwuiales bacterium]|nr:ATP F0F1 synthase subunit B [Minwuiales bacterium]